MANNSDCDTFPDIYDPLPNPEPPATDPAQVRYKQQQAIYRAVKKVLEDDFKFKDIPNEPKDFPGKLTGDNLSRVCAIFGIINADNWLDPSNGKIKPNTDDVQLDGVNGPVIDRRFIDAVVDAVKEYTSSAALFNDVFTLMQAEAAKGAPTASNSKSTR
jgi:hypothetical protein